MNRREKRMRSGYLRQIFAAMGIAVFVAGCSTDEIAVSRPFPASIGKSEAHAAIGVYELRNFTETPQAGKRAANLIEGVLGARGYRVVDLLGKEALSATQKTHYARSRGIPYILVGAVNEWRYKTGIDGEPAVSLTLRLIDTGSGKVIWSGAASDSNWGNASIGTTAQSLIDGMLR